MIDRQRQGETDTQTDRKTQRQENRKKQACIKPDDHRHENNKLKKKLPPKRADCHMATDKKTGTWPLMNR